MSVAYSPDGLSVVVGGFAMDGAGVQNWVIRKYSGAGFAIVTTIEANNSVAGGGNASITGVSFAPDGSSFVASGSGVDAGGNLCWVVRHYSGVGFTTITNLESSGTIAGGTSANANAVSYTPDGSAILAAGSAADGSAGGGLNHWMVRRYRGPGFGTIDTLENSFALTSGGTAYAASLQITPDGSGLVTGGNAYDIDLGNVFGVIKGLLLSP
jgi:WD40 repeat protein